MEYLPDYFNLIVLNAFCYSSGKIAPFTPQPLVDVMHYYRPTTQQHLK